MTASIQASPPLRLVTWKSGDGWSCFTSSPCSLRLAKRIASQSRVWKLSVRQSLAQLSSGLGMAKYSWLSIHAPRSLKCCPSSLKMLLGSFLLLEGDNGGASLGAGCQCDFRESIHARLLDARHGVVL